TSPATKIPSIFVLLSSYFLMYPLLSSSSLPLKTSVFGLCPMATNTPSHLISDDSFVYISYSNPFYLGFTKYFINNTIPNKRNPCIVVCSLLHYSCSSQLVSSMNNLDTIGKF